MARARLTDMLMRPRRWPRYHNGAEVGPQAVGAPMGYLRDGENVVVVASNAGLDRAPGRWLNLETDLTRRST